jgi:DnaK suppressor protein
MLLGMTDEQKNELQEILIHIKEELEGSAEYLAEETKAIEPSVSLGRLTRMEALGEKGVNEYVLAQNQKRLIRIENALKRMDEDKYGLCFACGKEIPFERLKLVPETLKCVPCMEKK